jgi:hypothetical protein
MTVGLDDALDEFQKKVDAGPEQVKQSSAQAALGNVRICSRRRSALMAPWPRFSARVAGP